MIIALCTVVAGGLGAIARWLADALINRLHRGAFPWATAVINIAGSLLLGLVAGLTVAQGRDGTWEQIIGTGFCGGFTTFSTASVESVRLLGQRHHGRAAAYVVGLVVVCVGVCTGGWLIGAAL